MDEIIRLIREGKLYKAMSLTESYVMARPGLCAEERVAAIRDDYELMADYWRRGFRDPQRNEVYGQLLNRLLLLVLDICQQEHVGASPILKNMYARVHDGKHDWSADGIRSRLEGFVSEAAVLQLEPEHVRKPKMQKMEEEHRAAVEDLFDYVLTSSLWSGNTARGFRELLTAPTVDAADQQVVVSAMTLSVMNVFDAQKFQVMAEVYQTAADEGVRQRALVGWGLCLSANPAVEDLFPEVRRTVEQMAEDERCREELTELQMQLLYCLNAENDTRKIHEEIMPELLKNNNFRVTRNGIEEVEEDPMEDILNPDSSEQRMERLEESMQKMVDMQRSGADIYFGGFAQMKRHPFFSQVCNWMLPFSPRHPSVSSVWEGTKGRRFLHRLMATGSFCDSDKYSFVLAFEKVVGMMPQKLMEMLETGEASMMGGEVEPEEKRKPAYIRRMYLQDMYRFFRLYPSRSIFLNPFDVTSNSHYYLIFSSELLRNTAFEKCMGEVVAVLLKHRLYADAAAVLANVGEGNHDCQYYVMYGTVLMHMDGKRTADELSVADCFRRALEMDGSNERALRGYARAAFSEHDYEGALEAYDRLLLTQESSTPNKNYLLNKAVCLQNLLRHEEALKILYRLDYEWPEDDNINRVLAWTLMGDGKMEQAAKVYTKLLSREQPDADDVLNDGLRLWICGEVTAAARRFRQVAELRDGQFDAQREFDVEAAELLKRNGISGVEIQLMKDELSC